MGKNIQYLFRNLNKKKLGKKYAAPWEPLNTPTFTDWINGNTYPRIDKIEKMANYLG